MGLAALVALALLPIVLAVPSDSRQRSIAALGDGVAAARCEGSLTSLVHPQLSVMSPNYRASLTEEVLTNVTAAVRSHTRCSLDGLSDYAVWTLLLDGAPLPQACGEAPACPASTQFVVGKSVGECGGGCCSQCGAHWSVVRTYVPVYARQPSDAALLDWIARHGNSQRMAFRGGMEFFPPNDAYQKHVQNSTCAEERAQAGEAPIPTNSSMWAPAARLRAAASAKGFGTGAGEVDGYAGVSGMCGDGHANPWGGYRRRAERPGPDFKVVFIEEKPEGSDLDSPWTGGSVWVEAWADATEARAWDHKYLDYAVRKVAMAAA